MPKYSSIPNTEAISPTAPMHNFTAFRRELTPAEGVNAELAD